MINWYISIGYGNEKSVVTEKAVDFKIELIDNNGNTTILKDNLSSGDAAMFGVFVTFFWHGTCYTGGDCQKTM